MRKVAALVGCEVRGEWNTCSQEAFTRHQCFVALGQSCSPVPLLASVSLGLSRSLSEPFEKAGRQVLALHAFVERAMRLAPPVQTVAALAGFCQTEMADFFRALLAHAEGPPLHMHDACRRHFGRLQTLETLADSVEWNLAPHAMSRALLDRTHAVWQRMRFQQGVFAESLLQAVMAPMERMILAHIGISGDGNGSGGTTKVTEEFFLHGVRYPVVFEEHAVRIAQVGKSMAILRQMREPPALVNQQQSQSVLDKVDALYTTEGKRLVRLILGEWGGMDTAKRMRLSIKGEKAADGNCNDDEDHHYLGHEQREERFVWPVSELIATPTNVSRYRAVQSFLLRLRSCKHRLSHTAWTGMGMRFRHKALHAMSALLSAMWLRLEQEDWESFSAQWALQCQDYEELVAMHNDYVERLYDIALQSESSRPLLAAIERAARVVDTFCDHGGGSEPQLEREFDQHMSLFEQIVEGILAQRKIGHLKALLMALKGMGHEN